MGNAESKRRGRAGRRPRVLCLHGWRTSGDVLEGQMKAFSSQVPQIDLVFVNAPLPATGPPDELIAFFYANMPYYQWHDNDPATIEADIKRSLDFLTQVVRSQGPFDGVLGFSQGAEMATRLVQKLEAQRGDAATVGGGSQLEGVILIGGVEPQFHTSNEIVIRTPSLHIHGAEDQYLERSRLLLTFYEQATSTVLVHQEMHNIPSLRTDLYPMINDWVREHLL